MCAAASPAVSVVLPVYNAAATVGRAVMSILNQTLRDLELIVVDDGSSDNTVAVVAAIDDPRLRLLQCPHRGVAAAANSGAAAARAPLIARMDADDFSYPGRLATQRDFLLAGGYDAAGSQVSIVDENGVTVSSLARYERWINEETASVAQIAALRFVELPLVTPSLLARREYFALGFCEGPFPEDYDLLLRAAAAGMKLGKVPQVLLDWIDHPRRLTRNHRQYSTDAFMQCRRHHLLQGPLRGVKEVDLWGVGPTGKRWLRWLQSQRIRVRHSYDLAPRKIGKFIHGVEVLHPAQQPPRGGAPMLVAVGAANARQDIGPELQSHGYKSGEDLWFVA